MSKNDALKLIANYPFSRAEELSAEQMREIARKALAQPEQEPLGWIASMAHNDLRDGIFREVTIYGAESDETVPIYTTPPHRQPMTIPEDVVKAARLMQDGDYCGPIFFAKKVFDWVVANGIGAKP